MALSVLLQSLTVYDADGFSNCNNIILTFSIYLEQILVAYQNVSYLSH